MITNTLNVILGGSTMQKTLKQLGINEDNPDLITVVTEMKKRSKKKLGHWLTIIVLFIFGITFLTLFISIFPVIINAYIDTHSIGDYILLTIATVLFIPFLAFVTYLCLGMVIYAIKEKPKWYLALFEDNVLYKEYDEKSKKYREESYPISSIEKCIVLKTEHVNFLSIKGRARESVHYTISVHIECVNESRPHYLHLLRPDGFKELNKVLSFLQDKKQIPIYYTYAAGEKYNYERRDERSLIDEFPQKPLEFSGHLEDFSEREFVRKVNRFEALRRSSEQLQNRK